MASKKMKKDLLSPAEKLKVIVSLEDTKKLGEHLQSVEKEKIASLIRSIPGDDACGLFFVLIDAIDEFPEDAGQWELWLKHCLLSCPEKIRVHERFQTRASSLLHRIELRSRQTAKLHGLRAKCLLIKEKFLSGAKTTIPEIDAEKTTKTIYMESESSSNSEGEEYVFQNRKNKSLSDLRKLSKSVKGDSQSEEED
eukprot:GHVN01068064.1.p1 GENE.GHVN01068064.1~~GHVN01068064.1.p1  ORF type:complete len:196 (+),score=24.49 GHVN01068064.1:195-782(+)